MAPFFYDCMKIIGFRLLLLLVVIAEPGLLN
jgi:hypothetical protein